MLMWLVPGAYGPLACGSGDDDRGVLLAGGLARLLWPWAEAAVVAAVEATVGACAVWLRKPLA